MTHMETMDTGTSPRQQPHSMMLMMDEVESAGEMVDTIPEGDGEDAVFNALGIMTEPHRNPQLNNSPMMMTEDTYKVIPNPDADVVDLSDLRGTRAPTTGTEHLDTTKKEELNDDLEALAELVPELRARNRGSSSEGHTMTMGEQLINQQDDELKVGFQTHSFAAEEEGVEVDLEESEEEEQDSPTKSANESPMIPSHYRPNATENKDKVDDASNLEHIDSMQVHQSVDDDDGNGKVDTESELSVADIAAAAAAAKTEGASLPSTDKNLETFDNEDQNLGGFDDVNSDNALHSADSDDRLGEDIKGVRWKKGTEKEDAKVESSNASLSTATQTHEVRMPMYLPTFKPATGCTNASDFIVRCFVARLRSGITVVKHGRSRWCKSRLRILHIHPDGRSLSWKPAVGEPSSSKRPPKLDLATCREVRHAWSPDPLNPMFTGTVILRQKCVAVNAHKSFALIFPKRTVDITAVTADQCKVLMEGFSALCFRLQVANLAGKRNGGKESNEEEEVDTTTASVTLTNTSTQLSPSGSGTRSKHNKKRNSHR